MRYHHPVCLDHLGLVTCDLAMAARAMQRAGFCVAPLSFHCERAPGLDAPRKTGTANQCLMFRRGYLEMLGIVDAQRYSGWITGALSRYQGLHIVGFGHEDIQSLVARLTAQGREPLVRRLTRMVEIDGEERAASFTILFHSDAEFPEGRFVTMQHHTPDVLWHPSLLNHPNGAQALAGVTLVVDDPDEFAGRVSACSAAAQTRMAAEALRLHFPGGFIEAMSAREARSVYGSALPSPLPPIVGMTIEVAELAATALLLKQHRIEHQDTSSGVLVPAAECCGAFIHFIQEV